MNIKKQLSNLDERQRDSIIFILKKLQKGELLKSDDCGYIGMDIHNCKQKFIMEFLNISRPTINAWQEMGCPRNSDGSYDLPMVFEWRLKYEREKNQNGKSDEARVDLEKEKLRLQCDKLMLEIDERKMNSIAINDHNVEMREAMLAFCGYFTDYGKMNLHLLVGQPIEQIRKYWDDLVRLGMNHFSEAKEKKQ